jgi:hypothetical protein
MDSIKALQRQRNQSRDLVAQETVTASQTSSCGTVTVTADDSSGGDGGGDGGDGDGGTTPVESGIGTTPIAIAGGVGLLGVLLLLLN